MTEWEQSLREILRRITEADAAKLWGHPDEPAPFNYRFEHTRAVVSTARYLQQHEGGDYRVIMAAAWLHDIDKHFVKRPDDAPGRPHHGFRGAQQAAEILAGMGFSEDEIARVHDAIVTHVGIFHDDVKRTLEGDILWDADKLTKVGAVSIIHSFGVAPAFGPVNTEYVIERGLKWSATLNDTVAAFKTPTARRLGKERLAYLDEFYHRLNAEFTME